MYRESFEGGLTPKLWFDPTVPIPCARRFPPPWPVEETDACFIVKDHAGHSLAYVYFEEEPGPAGPAAIRQTRHPVTSITSTAAGLVQAVWRRAELAPCGPP
jgi:hypothetical protein